MDNTLREFLLLLLLYIIKQYIILYVIKQQINIITSNTRSALHYWTTTFAMADLGRNKANNFINIKHSKKILKKINSKMLIVTDTCLINVN